MKQASEGKEEIKARFLVAGDSAIVVEFGDAIDDRVNDLVYSLAAALEDAPPWLVELVPTYRSLLVQYDPLAAGYTDVADHLERLTSGSTPELNADHPAAGHSARPVLRARVYKLPVAYGGEHGPDLATVAQHSGLSEDEVVRIHSSTDYRVFMIGFAPGFPYLGGMDQRIACPRLKTPRTRVPAGAVGIAESQTGVYPNESPGGWQLIGLTPAPLFDASRDPPSLIQPGAFVRFVPVDHAEFEQIKGEIAAGSYEVSVEERDR